MKTMKTRIKAYKNLAMALIGLTIVSATDADENLSYKQLYNRAAGMFPPKTTESLYPGDSASLQISGGKILSKNKETIIFETGTKPTALLWKGKFKRRHVRVVLNFGMESDTSGKFRLFTLQNDRCNRCGNWQKYLPGKNNKMRIVMHGKDFSGFKMEIQSTPGQKITLKKLSVSASRYVGFFRKKFTVPDGIIWSAVADIGNQAELYVNGKKVEDKSIVMPRPVMGTGAMYQSKDVSLKPYLKSGENTIALYAMRCGYPCCAYLRGSIIMESGKRLVLDSGKDWKWATEAPQNWYKPEFNDSSWNKAFEKGTGIQSLIRSKNSAKIMPVTAFHFHYRNKGDMPAYDGFIIIRNPYERKLFYTDAKPFEALLEIPAGLKDRKPEIKWQINKFIAKNKFKTVASGDCKSFAQKAGSLIFTAKTGLLKSGVYMFSSSLFINGKIKEQRTPEPFVVTGKVPMKPVAGDFLEQGMKLKLERTVDFTDPKSPYPSVETDNKALLPYKMSRNWSKEFYHTVPPEIVSRNGLKYRETANRYWAQFSYKVDFGNPGGWYLMELEYPDDMERWIGVSCSASSRMKKKGMPDASSKCAPSIWVGGKYPNTGKMLKMKWIYRPDPGPHAINVIALLKKGTAAATKLNIYRIEGNLPELASPEIPLEKQRKFGVLTERTSAPPKFNGYFNIFSSIEAIPKGAGRDNVPAVEGCQYLACWLDAAEHWAEYMRFSGQNLHVMGAWQYNDRNTCPQFITGSSRIQCNCRDIAARVFQSNDIEFYASVEFVNTYKRDLAFASAKQQDCFFADKNGHFGGEITGAGTIGINFLHPEVEKDMLDVARQLAEEFKDLPNFRGINWTAFFGGSWLPAYRGKESEALNLGYDDFTVKLFEKETRSKVPGKDDYPGRFMKRYKYLTSESVKQKWRAWRAAKLQQFFAKVIKTIKPVRNDLECIAGCYTNYHHVDEWKKSGKTFARYLLDWGWNVKNFEKTPNLWLMCWLSMNGGQSAVNKIDNYGIGWLANMDPEFYKPFKNLTRRAIMLRVGWQEVELIPSHFPYREKWPRPFQQTTMGQPREELAMEPFTQAMTGMDPQMMCFGFTDQSPYIGIEDVQRKFSRVFKRLPMTNFKTVLDTGFKTNLSIRAAIHDGKYYFYVINPGYWPVKGSVTIENAPKIMNLVSGKFAGNGKVNVDLQPFGIAAFAVPSADAKITGWNVKPVPEEKLAHVKNITAQADAALQTSGMREFLGAENYRYLKNTTAQIRKDLSAKQYAKAWYAATYYRFWNLLFKKVPDAKFAANVGTREMIAVEAETAPVIDGKLDDTVWKYCIPADRFVKSSKDLSTLKSSVLCAWKDNKLYLAFDFKDPEPGKIRAHKPTANEKNLLIKKDDFADFVIKPAAENYYQFAFNPANAKFDQKCTVRGGRNYQYAPNWKTAAVINKNGWTAEVEIDTAEAFGCTMKAGDAWEINIHRAFRLDSTKASSWVWNTGWHSMDHMGKLKFVPRNLFENPSAEILNRNWPVNWGKYRSCGKFVFSVSDKERHSGKYSLKTRLIEFGKRGIAGGAVLAANSNGYRYSKFKVEPDTKYNFSFWMKADAPYIRVRTFLFSDKKRKNVKTNLDFMKPRGTSWFQYSGSFKTGPDTKTAALGFHLNGRDKKWGKNLPLKINSAMYIDDVLIWKSKK